MDIFERSLRKLKTVNYLKTCRQLSWKVFRINFKQCSDATFDRNLFIRKQEKVFKNVGHLFRKRIKENCLKEVRINNNKSS